MVRLLAFALLVTAGCSAPGGDALWGESPAPSEAVGGSIAGATAEPAAGTPSDGGMAGETPAVVGSSAGGVEPAAGIGGGTSAAGRSGYIGGTAGAASSGSSGAQPTAGRGGSGDTGGAAGAAGSSGEAGSADAGGGCPAFQCLSDTECATPGHTSTSTAPVYNPKTKCFTYQATCYPTDFPAACVPEACWKPGGYCT